MNCLFCNNQLSVRLTLRDIFLPGKLTPSLLCLCCMHRFMPCQGKQCPGCSRQGEEGLCQECQGWQQKYGWHLHHQALYQYNDAMKEYMHRYKFMGDYRLRAVFQAEFSKRVKQTESDVIVPIPVTANAWQNRGFNQVTGLLREVEYQNLLVAKLKDKRAQSSKTRAERLRTPQPFELPKGIDIVGKRILLVDDVYTTGRTLYHAASLFKQAGCGKIESVSLAR